MMAYVAAQTQPPPPNRIIKTYTIGTGPKLDAGGLSSLATSPNEGSVDTTPIRIVPLGTSQGSKGVTIPQLQVGQQYTASVIIPLQLLPGATSNQSPIGPGSTPKSPVVSRQQDQLLFQASMTVNNIIAGLHLLRFSAVPQARSGSQIFSASTSTGHLPVGQQYSSFHVLCTVTFAAEINTSEGVVGIGTEGRLTRQAGGGAT
jgi:hypothetical protein